MGEQFSWSKFFTGLVDPTAYFKSLAIVIRISLVVLIIWGVWIAGNFIQSKLSPKRTVHPSVFNVDGQMGGNVRNSADQKETKFGILNF